MHVVPRLSDKPFDDMTEEEKVAWAKAHVATRRTKVTENAMATSKKKLAKARLVQREQDAKLYADPERRARKFRNYNEKLKLLYKYNQEYRELKQYQVALRQFRMRRDNYEAWTHKYYQTMRGKMDTKASIFKIEGTENYMSGFTESELQTYAPMAKQLFNLLLKDDLFPRPQYRGHRYVNTKLKNEPEAFYLVTEVEAFLAVFVKYRKKFLLIRTDDQKKYLKKQLWTAMLKAREEFDNQ